MTPVAVLNQGRMDFFSEKLGRIGGKSPTQCTEQEKKAKNCTPANYGWAGG